MINAPRFDSDGYPAEDWLTELAVFTGEPEPLLCALQAAWRYPEMAQEIRPGVWRFATGGWSGNESLMSAAQSSTCWLCAIERKYLYLPGGGYYICLDGEEFDKVGDLIHGFFPWKEAAGE